MLFHCFWTDKWPTVLVVAPDVEAASSAAAKSCNGDVPSLVVPVAKPAAAFVLCEVDFVSEAEADVASPDGDGDGDDEAGDDSFDVVQLVPTDEVAELLSQLEDAALDTAGDVEAVDGALVVGICGDAIQDGDGGPTVVCTLDAEHEGDHTGKHPTTTELVAWPQEETEGG